MGVPVIAIDGPSASGKGAVAQEVARILGFHYLDSGLIYRLTALAARRANIDLNDELSLVRLIPTLNVSFKEDDVWLNETAVSGEVRSETCGAEASVIAILPQVREALLRRQREFRKPPGLVAEGRDMGSVVFPDAHLKIYLDASTETRALRRYKQLMEKGLYANLDEILHGIKARDLRDSTRAVAPLQQSVDTFFLDSSALTVEETVATIILQYKKSHSL